MIRKIPFPFPKWLVVYINLYRKWGNRFVFGCMAMLLLSVHAMPPFNNEAKDALILFGIGGIILIPLSIHEFVGEYRSRKTTIAKSTLMLLQTFGFSLFIFADIYWLLYQFNPSNFGTTLSTGWDSLYWSFLILMNHGDPSPITGIAKLLCAAETLTGWFESAVFVALILARIK